MVEWRLRECLARRGVTQQDLAKACRVSKMSVSNWYQHDYLPAIGASRIEEIRVAIESLSSDRWGPCRTSEFVKLEVNNA
jgi:transcriptional regulator with XRE-family HTH domain